MVRDSGEWMSLAKHIPGKELQRQRCTAGFLFCAGWTTFLPNKESDYQAGTGCEKVGRSG
ncbi:MAG: hypothetical protein NVSMB62_29680 [Acidobacteriaceae bacterium]